MKIILLAVLALATLTSCGPNKIDTLIFPRDQQTIARGMQLTTGLAACGVCHGQQAVPESPLSGGRNAHDMYGSIPVPNITPGKSGIGEWSDEQVLGALRGRWGDESKYRSPEIHRGYEWMSDKDAMSVVSYLRTLTPIRNTVEKRNVSFMDRNTTGFFEAHLTVAGYVPEVSKKNKVQYGRYLVDHVARCGTCHSTPATLLTSVVYLGGGEVKNDSGTRSAPGLIGYDDTMSSWSEPAIVSYLKSGLRPDGSSVDTRFCPIPFYKNSSDEDLEAIALYVRSLS